VTENFVIEKPEFDSGAATATFRYRLDGLAFTEILRFAALPDPDAAR
jgi:hypothetical protein